MPLVSSTQARAVTVPLIIQQGADFSHVLGLQNSDGTVFVLTGYSAKMQVREVVGSAVILLELSTTNNRIAINGLAGQMTLTLANALTTAMTWRSGVYALEITSGAGLVTRVMEGSITLSPEVTI